jgi:transposase InsO family protein
LPVFKNLIQGREASRPNEVWVGDVTYLRTDEGFMYLSLLTDKVSRHIVGHHCGDSLEVTGCLAALDMALQQLPEGARPIHHSDRGSQYCCHEYVNRSVEGGLTLSMTETDHCAENALAERMNGILKGEYGLDQRFKTKVLAKQAATQAIHLYGTRRPHTALGHQFPAVVHASFLPPAPPSSGLPGHWDPGARPELRTGVPSPAQVGATTVADQPVQPLRGR